MSAKATAWAWAQPVTGLTKLVLLTLADVANQEDKTWYSRKHLAQRATVSVATLDRAVRELQELKLVDVQQRHREDGSLMSCVYQLLIGGNACTTPESGGTIQQPLGTDQLTQQESNSESKRESVKNTIVKRQRILELRPTFIDEACMKYPQWDRGKVERLVANAVNYYLPEMQRGRYQDLNLCVWNNLAEKAEKETTLGTKPGHPPLSQFTRGAGSPAPVRRTEEERRAARTTRYTG